MSDDYLGRTDYLAVMAALRALNTVVMALDADLLRRFINTAERADTLGPFIDPTLWRDAHGIHRSVIEAARLAATHRQGLAKLQENVT